MKGVGCHMPEDGNKALPILDRSRVNGIISVQGDVRVLVYAGELRGLLKLCQSLQTSHLRG